jgi:alpha-aminoadipate carrier protein LysW
MEKNSTVCPECGETITVSGEILVGWLLDCPNCDTELEIVKTAPLKLDFFYGDDEDDYEDDEDYEEEDDEQDDDL